MDDLKIYRGGEVKASADGRYRTLLVRFSDPSDVDLYGDFFTKDTYFGDAIRRGGKLDVYYDHGFDGMVKRAPIGVADVKFDEVGVWLEGQIEISDEHFEKFGDKAKAKAVEAAIRNLAVKGKLGSSSGAVGHLTEVVEVAGYDSHWIKSWPIGEGSLTPRPADPKKAKVETIKSFVDVPSDVDLASVVKSVSEGATEVHIHYHNEAPKAQETNMADENTPVQEPVKNAPAPEAPDVQALVAAQVKAAMEAEAERQRQAKAAEEAEEKRINEEVEKRFKQFAGSRTYSTPFAIRTNGITKDDFPEAFKWFLANKGDTSALKGHEGVEVSGTEWEISLNAVQEQRARKGLPLIGSDSYVKSWKASNATDMNTTTAADGGDTVPTGFFNQIIMRRDEMALHRKLGCRNIPGVGTTVDVPLDGESDGEFIATNQASQFDNDSPAVSKVSLTLRKFSKRTLISDELLQDTGINILGYVQDRVAIGWAKTMNNELVTEAVTGTQYLRGGSTTGFAAGEFETLVYNATLAPYADGFDLAFVMRSPTYGTIISITGSDRLYGNVHAGPTEAGVGADRLLLGYPVYFSQKVAAVAARAKSVIFGAWSYMLYRESPSLNFLYDPYTLADYGQARMLWYIRTDFELAQAGAVGYFEHDLT